ncbi:large ribosomal subunit protein bL19m [Neodiprion pinetum]|uniref:Large ribosomal subunit protein bL19m n=1 Tax=Neodiprion lecontei TaxID=441921 RepID=A0A6J0C554_NEOLC|nr:39S ribosomal protein L19, mitochondrial [Neodiprion lecontei]XP_046426862.1 39S ribosomal protein L19, mitochondrial [Neodiprion fabricii]XP_046481305.1 39S ribosomal protein L19, mitochondrial [Neodiprion pinetum]XP_046618677.1 39S ribosomal protein L19, mitochondrial [Neodiprion virginianus]
MASVGRILSHDIRQNIQNFKSLFGKDCRWLSSQAIETQAKSSKENADDKRKVDDRENTAPLEFRFKYPEFLPDPNAAYRNSTRERLERMDMMARRAHIDIPTFYVGSILAVTLSDSHAVGKTNRFVGICIERKGCGLRASFRLRNAIDKQGMEVVYNMYDPTIQKVECLRLEKRLDDKLLYLRDCPIEYSTFPFDMEPELIDETAPVRINTLKVPLKPPPWLERWERQDLKGVQEFEVNEKRRRKAEKHKTPWEEFDLMKIYRQTIPMEDQKDIFAEVYSDLHKLEITRRKMARKRKFNRPDKPT